MRRLGLKNNTLYPPFETPKCVREPLSEAEILDLQDAFLSNGFHHIRVKNLNAGRSIIKVFLDSLRVYNEVACLTSSDIQLDKTICNIYTNLARDGYLDQLSIADLDEFLIEQFYFDFMWIEATKDILLSAWFSDFQDKIIDFKLDEHIPVVILSYDE